MFEYIHVYTYMDMCIHIYIYIYYIINTCIHTCVYIYIHMCIYIYIYTHINTYTRTHIFISYPTQVQMVGWGGGELLQIGRQRPGPPLVPHLAAPSAQTAMGHLIHTHIHNNINTTTYTLIHIHMHIHSWGINLGFLVFVDFLIFQTNPQS